MIKSYAGSSRYSTRVVEKEYMTYAEGSTKSLATLLDELQSDVDGIAEEDAIRWQMEDFGTVKLPLARRIYAKLIKDED